MGRKILGPGSRVAGYCRFSSNNQREESIIAQKRAISDLCKANKWDIVDWYIDEAKSGLTADREHFQAMLADSASGLFDIVLVHKLDRFGREAYDQITYARQLLENGVILQSVREPVDDTPEGEFMGWMLRGMNQYFSRNLAVEVMKGLAFT